jgi:hypothetical protein
MGWEGWLQRGIPEVQMRASYFRIKVGKMSHVLNRLLEVDEVS